MAKPTDEQLAKRGMTRDQFNRRNELWHKMLRDLPPDERERINKDPNGQEALIMATHVDFIVTEAEKKAGLESPKPAAP